MKTKTWNDLRRENAAEAIRDVQNAGTGAHRPEFNRKFEARLLNLCVTAAKREGVTIPGSDTPTGRVTFSLALRDVRQGDPTYAAEYAMAWAAEQAAAKTPPPPPPPPARSAPPPAAPSHTRAVGRTVATPAVPLKQAASAQPWQEALAFLVAHPRGGSETQAQRQALSTLYQYCVRDAEGRSNDRPYYAFTAAWMAATKPSEAALVTAAETLRTATLRLYRKEAA
jgi:hypothetical protein